MSRNISINSNCKEHGTSWEDCFRKVGDDLALPEKEPDGTTCDSCLTYYDGELFQPIPPEHDLATDLQEAKGYLKRIALALETMHGPGGALKGPIILFPSETVPGQWVIQDLISDVVTQGNSPEHALSMLREAVGICQEADKERGVDQVRMPAPADHWPEDLLHIRNAILDKL